MAEVSRHDPRLVGEIASHYEAILRLVGEDPTREGLVKTPVRAAKALLDITSGYRNDPLAIARQAVFEHAGKMIGLPKLARIVDNFARRLQVQERLTAQVCALLSEAMPTKGVIVSCTAEHLCMKMRGVEKQDSATVTYDYNGLFETDPGLREEFRSLVATID